MGGAVLFITLHVRRHRKNFSPVDKPEQPALATPIFNRLCQIGHCKVTERPYLSHRAKIEKT